MSMYALPSFRRPALRWRLDPYPTFTRRPNWPPQWLRRAITRLGRRRKSACHGARRASLTVAAMRCGTALLRYGR